MKIGLLSDIHGDIEHLTLALRLLDSHKVDQVLCCGDLTDGGESQINAVINAIRAHNIPCVLGNHDEMTDKEQQLLLEDQRRADELLKPENIDFLHQLPRMTLYEFAGKTLALFHATPWSNDIHIFSYSSDQLIQQVAAQSKADCAVFGHTHEAMRLHVNDVWLFNPGSVYLNRFERTHTCAILSLPDFDYTVYDIKTGLPQRIPYIT
ncbi:MAG TPA: metallophosphoesterase family protein [Phototrophicaceae bacterium]|jgi:putative phosphoesterase|nr:metallophosphoesterase family protein [Phototrophicaceae bacterium]